MFLRQRRYLWVATVLLSLFSSISHAAVDDAQLVQEYGNKVLTLRRFYPGSKLHFDSSGNLSAPTKPEAWTIYGQFRVQKIYLKNEIVHIEGQRLFLFYDPERKQLRDFVTMSKDEAQARHVNKKLIEKALKDARVEIDIHCGTATPEIADVAKVMGEVVFPPDQPLSEIVPIYWKHWMDSKVDSQESSSEGAANAPHVGGSPYRVGGHVSPPHVDYDPDPEYTAVASALRYQGTVILWLVVNKEGQPTHIRIQRALGLGLDDMAVAAVERWKFTPAKKDGEPVPVMINVEVNFRLY